MNFVSFSSGGQKASMGLAGLESRGEQGCTASEGSRGEPVPCHVQLQMLPPFLCPYVPVTSAPLGTSPLVLTLLLPSCTYEGPCGYPGPTWVIQDNLPI